MKKNYAGLASLIAFVLAVPVPVALMVIFPRGVESLSRSQGSEGLLLLTIVWVGGLAVVGTVLGALGLYLAWRGRGGRAISIVGLVLNLPFVLIQVRNLGLF